jgi:hypothetical protein
MRRPMKLLFFAISLSFPAVSSAGPGAPATTQPGAEKKVVYTNHQYGFKFFLPESWRGFTVEEVQWDGQINETRRMERGPEIVIHHPLDREDNPRQYIPIMVLTHCQWREIDDNSLVVSAAPYPPGEIGRNRKFVFAIPPRYTSEDLDGVEEVVSIFSGQPLRAIRNAAGNPSGCD